MEEIKAVVVEREAQAAAEREAAEEEVAADTAEGTALADESTDAEAPATAEEGE